MNSELTVYEQVELAKKELNTAGTACNIICLAIWVAPPVLFGGTFALLMGSLVGGAVMGIPVLFFTSCASAASRLWLFTPSAEYKKYTALVEQSNKQTEETLKNLEGS